MIDLQQSILLWTMTAFLAALIFLDDDSEDDDDQGGGMMQPVYQGVNI